MKLTQFFVLPHNIRKRDNIDCNDLFKIIATISYQTFLNNKEHKNWEPWLDTHFTKVVKYAKSKNDFDQLVKKAQNDNQELKVSYKDNEPFCVATVPMELENAPIEVQKGKLGSIYVRNETTDYSFLDKNISKIIREIGKDHRRESLFIVVNKDLELTDGKMAAQVAHALFAWAKSKNYPETIPDIRIVNTNIMDHIVNVIDGIEIVDSARTELPSPAITTFAFKVDLKEWTPKLRLTCALTGKTVERSWDIGEGTILTGEAGYGSEFDMEEFSVFISDEGLAQLAEIPLPKSD